MLLPIARDLRPLARAIAKLSGRPTLLELAQAQVGVTRLRFPHLIELLEVANLRSGRRRWQSRVNLDKVVCGSNLVGVEVLILSAPLLSLPEHVFGYKGMG